MALDEPTAGAESVRCRAVDRPALMASGERIASLQILRFVAALAVVIMHVGHLIRVTVWGDTRFPYLATDIGAAGVDVFFVLSGFVIAFTGPLADPKPTAKGFLWRRFSRVSPPFYLFSIAFLVQAASEGALNWPQTIATFAFWPAAGPHAVQPYLTAGWTLGFEMLFYSAASFWLIGGRTRRNLAAIGAAMAALCAWRFVSPSVAIRVLANPIFLEFAFGVALASAARWLQRADLKLGVAAIATGVGAFLYHATVGFGDAAEWQEVLSGDALHRVFVFGFPAAALVGGAIICDRAVSGPLARLLSRLGDASYSLYLTQAFMVAFLVDAWALTLGRRWPIAMAFVAIAGCVAFGSWAHTWIEQPLLRAVRSLRVQRQQAAGVAARVAARH